MLRIRLATTGVGVAVAAVTCLSIGLPASAASTGIWYYAGQGSKLVKVDLVGSKLTTSKTLSSSTNKNIAFEPMSALGSFVTGIRGLYNATTHNYANVLFTYDSAHGKFRVLTSTKHDQVVWAALYNSGKSVAFIDLSGGRYKIREVASTGGTPATKYTAPASMTLSSLAVSHNGGTLYFGGTTSGSAKVYSVAAGSTRLHALTSAVKGIGMTALSLSPSGTTLAYSPWVFPPSTTGIRLVKVASGGVTKSISYHGTATTTSWSSNGTLIYNADQSFNGWSKNTVSTGKSAQLDQSSTGRYFYPVRA